MKVVHTQGIRVFIAAAALAASGCAFDDSDDSDDAVASVESVVYSGRSTGSGSGGGGYCSAYDVSCEWCQAWEGATTMDVPGPIPPVPDPASVTCREFVKAVVKRGISSETGLKMYKAYKVGIRGIGPGCASLLAWCAGLTYPNNNNCVAVATSIGC